MRYQDCPGCACLVGVGESACPFCGQVLRSVTASGWLTLGLVLSLGTVSVSCGEKGDDGDTEDTVTASDSDSQGPDSNGEVADADSAPDGVTYAGPDEDSLTDPSSSSGAPHTTMDSTPDGSTYAGPDETASASEASTGEGDTGDTGSTGSTGSTGEGSTGTSTTTDSDSDSNGEGATYAGADVPDPV